tara:strand:+ start:2416 stop:2991 length:576 start_codon:yes stop_codon:yes gene_type:complete
MKSKKKKYQKKMKPFSINEKCLICFETFEETKDEIAVQLLCAHGFHYDCIMESYKMKTSVDGYKQSKRECPYCRCKGGYLPLLEGMKPVKNVHKEWDIQEKHNKYYGAWGQCKGFTKAGKRCTNRAKAIVGHYCGKHKSQYKPPPVPETTCPIITPENITETTINELSYGLNQVDIEPTPEIPTGPPVLTV